MQGPLERPVEGPMEGPIFVARRFDLGKSGGERAHLMRFSYLGLSAPITIPTMQYIQEQGLQGGRVGGVLMPSVLPVVISAGLSSIKSGSCPQGGLGHLLLFLRFLSRLAWFMSLLFLIGGKPTWGSGLSVLSLLCTEKALRSF